MLASLAAVAVNLVWCALTYRALGVAGLALGTTLGALVNYRDPAARVHRARPPGRGTPRAAGHRPREVARAALLALATSNAAMALGGLGLLARLGVWLCAGADQRLHGALAGAVAGARHRAGLPELRVHAAGLAVPGRRGAAGHPGSDW